MYADESLFTWLHACDMALLHLFQLIKRLQTYSYYRIQNIVLTVFEFNPIRYGDGEQISPPQCFSPGSQNGFFDFYIRVFHIGTFSFLRTVEHRPR